MVSIKSLLLSAFLFNFASSAESPEDLLAEKLHTNLKSCVEKAVQKKKSAVACQTGRAWRYVYFGFRVENIQWECNIIPSEISSLWECNIKRTSEKPRTGQ